MVLHNGATQHTLSSPGLTKKLDLMAEASIQYLRAIPPLLSRDLRVEIDLYGFGTFSDRKFIEAHTSNTKRGRRLAWKCYQD